MAPAAWQADTGVKRPYRFAITLAGAAIGGFVGMMLVEGLWAWPLLGLAACPAALAAFGFAHRRRGQTHA